MQRIHWHVQICAWILIWYFRCSNSESRVAAYDILTELAHGNLDNMATISHELTGMHHQPNPELASQWEVSFWILLEFYTIDIEKHITLFYIMFQMPLNTYSECPMVHKQIHVIGNTVHRPSMQAGSRQAGSQQFGFTAGQIHSRSGTTKQGK